MQAIQRCLAWALASAVAAAGGCKPPVPPVAGAKPLQLQPVTIVSFWTGFTSPDPAKVEAAIRLLSDNPEIADQPFAAEWSSLGGGALRPVSEGTWVFGDGARVTLDPTSVKHVHASIDAVVAAIEPDTSRRAQRKLELIALVDRVGIALWRASAAFERPGGGVFGESADERVFRELALFELRSHGLLLRRSMQEHLEKMPPELVGEADLERRKEELGSLRRIMLGDAPFTDTP